MQKTAFLFFRSFNWEAKVWPCSWDYFLLQHMQYWLSPNHVWKTMLATARKTAAAESLQSCPTLQWATTSFSSAWEWKVKGKPLSRVRPLATPWTAAHQAPPSMGFSRQEDWSGVPLPSPKGKLVMSYLDVTANPVTVRTYTHTHTHPHPLFPSHKWDYSEEWEASQRVSIS